MTLLISFSQQLTQSNNLTKLRFLRSDVSLTVKVQLDISDEISKKKLIIHNVIWSLERLLALAQDLETKVDVLPKILTYTDMLLHYQCHLHY